MNLNALVPWRSNKVQTPATREDFFDPFVTFRREVDRVFDHFFEGMPIRSGNGWQSLTPVVDVDQTDKEMVVTAELPGVSDKDVLQETFSPSREKKTEKEEKNGDAYYTERRFGSFIRSLRLPFEVKDDQVDIAAAQRTGILCQILPHAAQQTSSRNRQSGRTFS